MAAAPKPVHGTLVSGNMDQNLWFALLFNFQPHPNYLISPRKARALRLELRPFSEICSAEIAFADRILLNKLGAQVGVGQTSTRNWTAGFGACGHVPGFHLGYLFLTHSQVRFGKMRGLPATLLRNDQRTQNRAQQETIM